MILKFINFFKNKYLSWKKKRQYKKMLEEVRKRDPFIYH